VIAFTVVPEVFAQEDPLGDVEERVRTHAETILDQLEDKEESFRSLAEKEMENWKKGKNYTFEGGESIEGPEEHPWIKADKDKGANPDSLEDYKKDSKNAWDRQNNLTQTWSCFEPQLVAVQYNCRVPPIAAEADLAAECFAHCCLDNILNWDDERWEVIQYWFPEHQAAVNNYARMRLDPTDVPGDGSKFLRKQLLEKKKDDPEKKVKSEIEETWTMSLSEMKEPTREEPYKGQYQWQGATWDYNEHLSTHLYRSHIAVETAKDRPESRLGWDSESKSIFDALAPPPDEKQHLHIWTEYSVFDALTTNDSFWFTVDDQRVKKLMQALLDRRGDFEQRARENPAFYQSKGKAAYRVGKWSDPYEPIKDIAEIEADNNEDLKEVVFKRGNELYPLTMTFAGFEVPELTARAMAARRGFEIAGMKEMAKKMPGEEKARANTYTIDGDDKSREIDKVQMIYPLLESGKTAECHRSQKLPGMLHQTEDDWVKKNVPHDHMGYVKDDFSDSAYMYWNKRVSCSCKMDGLTTGSIAMNKPQDKFGEGRGDGDRIYGRLEKTLCTYKEGELPSAWAGETRPTCIEPGYGQQKEYKGIDDKDI
jgi:hypothetical protein